MDELQKLKAQVHALSIVTERLWANMFTNFTDDPIATVKRAAQESIDAHDELREKVAEAIGQISAGGDEVMQQILHYEEEFWNAVEQRVQRILDDRARRG